MKPTPRKVLLISADQWRGECIAAHGHPEVHTPQLDALAADALSFRRHYAQAAPCGPARASLLTGLYAMNHRSVRNGTPLDARHTNIALQARAAGYDPILFGYTDTSPDPRGRPPRDPALRSYQGVLPGFRVGVEFPDENPAAWIADLLGKGYPPPASPSDIYYPAAELRGASGAAAPWRAEDSDTAFIADRVIEHLRQNRDTDWFVHAVFFRPHPPFYAAEPWASHYDPATLRTPQRAATLDEEAAQHPFLDWWLRSHALPEYFLGKPLRSEQIDSAGLQRIRAAYYGLLSEVDQHIGRIVEHLKASGEYEQTLIIFTVDHGEMLGDHWLFDKGGYFEQSYHIPLIVRDPRPQAAAARGTGVDEFSESVDLMPTILDWLGCEVPAACDGESLLPFIEGRRPPRWRDAAHWEYDFRDLRHGRAEAALGLAPDQCNCAVLRGERYKYVHFAALPPLLFDLREDPGEFRNLAADPAHREVLLDCAQRLLSLRMTHADRTLANTLLCSGGPISYRGPRRR